MKTVFVLFFALLVAHLPASGQATVKEQKPFQLYAQFLQETRVELSDGAVWLMDKGDCFPIYMFKEHQTKIVLKLASTTFQVDAANLKVLPETDNEAALASYRKNLAEFLNKQPDIWKDQAKKKKPADAKETPPEKK